MALRPDRDYFTMDDISRHWDFNETSAQSAGGVASIVVAGSGASLGSSLGSGIHAGLGTVNTVNYKANPSGAVPIGMLLQDIVIPSEPNRYYKNYGKSAIAFPGEKVTLIRKGWLVTNSIFGTPTAGATAYLASSGLVTSVVPASPQNLQGPTVGKFETSKDEAGYARVFIDL